MIAYTTDTTPNGIRIARNALRLKLWDDAEFAHRWLCHRDGMACQDGCDCAAATERLKFYQSDLEK